MNARLKHRQAILTGLAPLLGDEQTLLALEIFDRGFADGTAFNLQKYVDRLHERLQPACARRDLHRALVKSVFLGVGGDEVEGSATHERASGGPPANRVFEQLTGGFLALVGNHRPRAEAAVRSYLIEKLSALDLTVGSQDALVEWLARRQPTIATPLPVAGMRNMLNLTYVLVCEYLGPVVADRLLAQAVAEAEALPEARLVAPRSLL